LGSPGERIWPHCGASPIGVVRRRPPVPSAVGSIDTTLVALGSRLSKTAGHGIGTSGSAVWSSLLLGVATGLLWAPCAGPILGLLLTGAALHGASAQTSLLLAAYAVGAATSLALALVIGGRGTTPVLRRKAPMD
jgi:cytochrome c biogenesis protein CcdA